MGQRTQGIHWFTIEQDVELHQIRVAEAIDMVVERSVTLRDTLQFIIEIDDNLTERQHEVQFHTVATHIFLINEFASLIQT